MLNSIFATAVKNKNYMCKEYPIRRGFIARLLTPKFNMPFMCCKWAYIWVSNYHYCADLVNLTALLSATGRVRFAGIRSTHRWQVPQETRLLRTRQSIRRQPQPSLPERDIGLPASIPQIELPSMTASRLHRYAGGNVDCVALRFTDNARVF